MMRLPLAKFDGSRHPRASDGKFASTRGAQAVMAALPAVRGHSGPSFLPHRLGERSPGPQIEQRSATRGESWQRIGSKIAALPVHYTGEKTMERPLGSYLHLSLVNQIPKQSSVEDHQARVKQFIQMTKDHRKEIIEAATKARVGKKHVYLKSNEPAANGVAKWRMKPDLFPEGTAPATLHRAYNHAALLAMHDRGLADYDFKMDDALKDELKPTEPFIRYARGRLNEHANIAMPGQRSAYMSEFGHDRVKMKDGKPTGETARRFRPNQQLIKAAPKTLNVPAKELLRAAGVMLISGSKADSHILLLKRGLDGPHPGEWCFPGGKIEAGETPRQAALREMSEEIGDADHSLFVNWAHRISDGVDFTTFAAHVSSQFTPKLNEEHTAFKWAPLDKLPTPMHPGCAIAIEKLKRAFWRAPVQPLNKGWLSPEDHPRHANGQFASKKYERVMRVAGAVGLSAAGFMYGHKLAPYTARLIRSGLTADNKIEHPTLYNMGRAMAREIEVNPKVMRYPLAFLGAGVGRDLGAQAGAYIDRKNRQKRVFGKPASGGLAKAFGTAAFRRVGASAVGAVDRAADSSRLARFGGQQVGAFVARSAKAVVRHPIKSVRNAAAEGASFGAGIASGAAAEFGLKGKGLRRAGRIGAVLGGGKLAVTGALVAHKPVMRAVNWATSTSSAQPAKVQKMHSPDVVPLAKRVPYYAAAPHLNQKQQSLSKVFDSSKHNRGSDGRWESTGAKVGLAVGAALGGHKAVGLYANDVRGLVTGKPLQGAYRGDADEAQGWRSGNEAALAQSALGEEKGARYVAASHAPEKLVGQFDHLVSQRLDHNNAPDVLFRGIHGKDAENWLRHKEGSVLKSVRFTSFTKDHSIAQHFTNWSFLRNEVPARHPRSELEQYPENSVGRVRAEETGHNVGKDEARAIIHLTGHKDLGMHVSSIDHFDNGQQGEFLVGRGSHFQINKVIKGKDGVNHIHAHLIGQDARAAFRSAILARLKHPQLHGLRLGVGLISAGIAGGVGAAVGAKTGQAAQAVFGREQAAEVAKRAPQIAAALASRSWAASATPASRSWAASATPASRS